MGQNNSFECANSFLFNCSEFKPKCKLIGRVVWGLIYRANSTGKLRFISKLTHQPNCYWGVITSNHKMEIWKECKAWLETHPTFMTFHLFGGLHLCINSWKQQLAFRCHFKFKFHITKSISNLNKFFLGISTR